MTDYSNKDQKYMITQALDHNTQGEDDDSGGKTGGGSHIEFRQFIAQENNRDDLLPPDQKKRLLDRHNTFNEKNIKKQKERFQTYKDLKEGKTSVQDFRQGAGVDAYQNAYKAHAILAYKAQFSGIDRQVNSLPNEQIADTNNDKRDELQYQYQLKHTPQYANVPKNAPPKPTPYNR